MINNAMAAENPFPPDGNRFPLKLEKLQEPLQIKITEAASETINVAQNKILCSFAINFNSLLVRKNHTTRMIAATSFVCPEVIG